MRFNLIDEPWIPVVTAEGDQREVGIREALGQAPRLRGLATESPLEEVSILRCLLALLHRALRGPGDEEDWAGLWDERRFPEAALDAYLRQWRDRFWLVHDEHPFFQCPSLAGRWRPFSEDLLPGNRPPFRFRQGDITLTPAEAARWLVTMQSFDGAGIKTGDPRDPSAKNGKGYGSPRGWADRLANVVAGGPSLFETLLLNLVMYAPDPRDRPAWEREPQTPLRSGRLPDGRCDVYTWQADRLLLHWEEAVVVGATVSPGDHADPSDEMALEPLTMWRRNKAASERTGRDVYVPATFGAPAQFWRGLGQLLPVGADKAPVPGIVESLAACSNHLDESLPVSFRRLIVERDQNGTIIQDLKSDRLDLPVRLVADPSLARLVQERLQAIEASCQAVGWFARRLSVAAYGEGGEQVAEEQARHDCYVALDEPVRRWVASFDASAPVDAQTAQLASTALHILGREAERRLSSVPVSAWRGRPGQRTPISLYEACRASLRKNLVPKGADNPS